jgi:hypothetical protein
MRIIDNLLNLRPVGDVAVRDPADGLLNSPALSQETAFSPPGMDFRHF